MTDGPNPTALDAAGVEPRIGSDYPAPFDEPCARRERRALGNPFGLSQFGVNLMTLPPGAWSSQRHWHEQEDEFVYVLEGEVTLITDAGERRLTPGMAAGFPAGNRDGHHLVNRSDRPAQVLEVGSRAEREFADYPDIDMTVEIAGGAARFQHRNGDPY